MRILKLAASSLLVLALGLTGLGSFMVKSAAGEESVYRAGVVSREEVLVKKANDTAPKVTNIYELHRKWREVMAGRSQAVLLDVRSKEHRSRCWIEGTRHVPSEQMDRIPNLLPSKDSEIWVFCRTSPRAVQVTRYLDSLGYKNLVLVDQSPSGTSGGITGWQEKRYPLFGSGCPE